MPERRLNTFEPDRWRQTLEVSQTVRPRRRPARQPAESVQQTRDLVLCTAGQLRVLRFDCCGIEVDSRGDPSAR
jgi:hypothetical protein